MSIIQPLIAPLYDGKSAHEILAVLGGQAGATGHDVVRGYWQRQKPGADFEQFWQTSLNNGVVADSALAPKPVKAQPVARQPRRQSASAGGIEIVLRPDPSIGDGSFANNGWLQELPKPLTKLTWDNAALVSPASARKLGVTNGDVVKLSGHGQAVEAPIWITPGHADDSLTLHLGYGRRRAGHVGTAWASMPTCSRPRTTPGSAAPTVEKTGKTYQLVTTQHHHIMGKEGEEREEESVAALQRKLVRGATLEEFRKNPEMIREEGEENGPSIYPGLHVRRQRLGHVHRSE